MLLIQMRREVNYAEFLLSNSNRVAARNLLKRGLQALSRNQHRDVIIRFASLEFRTGDPECGRTNPRQRGPDAREGVLGGEEGVLPWRPWLQRCRCTLTLLGLVGWWYGGAREAR